MSNMKLFESRQVRSTWSESEEIFSMLGEASTAAIVRTQNPKGSFKISKQPGKVEKLPATPGKHWN